jgi:hypothetical protein
VLSVRQLSENDGGSEGGRAKWKGRSTMHESESGGSNVRGFGDFGVQVQRGGCSSLRSVRVDVLGVWPM